MVVSVPAEVAEDMARLEYYKDNYPPIMLLVDSGADFHVVGNRDPLLDIEGCNKKLIAASGEYLGITGVGTLRMCLGEYLDTSGKERVLDIQIDNVYDTPECSFNLISLTQLNAVNIHLDTSLKSLIFPGPLDMMIPRKDEEIKFE